MPGIFDFLMGADPSTMMPQQQPAAPSIMSLLMGGQQSPHWSGLMQRGAVRGDPSNPDQASERAAPPTPPQMTNAAQPAPFRNDPMRPAAGSRDGRPVPMPTPRPGNAASGRMQGPALGATAPARREAPNGAAVLAGFAAHGPNSSIPSTASRGVTSTVVENARDARGQASMFGSAEPVSYRGSGVYSADRGGSSASALPALTQAGQAMGSGQQQSGGRGLLGGFGDLLTNLQPMFLGMAMGRNAGESLAYGGYMMNQSRETQKNQNETVKWLTGEGLGEQEARYLAKNKDALGAWYKSWKEGQKPDWKIHSLYNGDGREQPYMIDMRTGAMNPIGAAKASEGDKPTELMRNYEAAKKGGFAGSFVDYQLVGKRNSRPITPQERAAWGIPADDKRPYAMDESGKPTLIGGSGVNINLGDAEKLPSGFRWKNADEGAGRRADPRRPCYADAGRAGGARRRDGQFSEAGARDPEAPGERRVDRPL